MSCMEQIKQENLFFTHYDWTKTENYQQME